MKGILGRKIGMTQIYTEFGISVPVTVVEVQPNVVSKVLSSE
ncbi:50S ribosomal protein L3, partial [Mycoplasmopsis pullorum]